MKVVTIVGARPQFVKAAAVSRELEACGEVKEVLVHTGQHFDKNMSDIFFEQMQIKKPDYFLDINSLGHGAMTGQMLEKIEEILLREKPDWVLVYGDTNSTLAGSLAASKLNIKIAHVESGLRSFNTRMPEEINRILTDRVLTILFCPTDLAVENLVNEGFKDHNCKVVQSGDVMQDAAMFYSSMNGHDWSEISSLLPNNYILCTVHRAENTSDRRRMENIFEALNEINKSVNIVLPLHPRTKKIIEEYNIKCNFKVIEPVGYLDMIQLIKNCSYVVTDSGGLQKEAYFFSKYCITLRDETEWKELVDGGFNILAGANKLKILEAFKSIQTHNDEFDQTLYGSGRACKVIVTELVKY